MVVAVVLWNPEAIARTRSVDPLRSWSSPLKLAMQAVPVQVASAAGQLCIAELQVLTSPRQTCRVPLSAGLKRSRWARPVPGAPARGRDRHARVAVYEVRSAKLHPASANMGAFSPTSSAFRELALPCTARA